MTHFVFCVITRIDFLSIRRLKSVWWCKSKHYLIQFTTYQLTHSLHCSKQIWVTNNDISHNENWVSGTWNISKLWIFCFKQSNKSPTIKFSFIKIRALCRGCCYIQIKTLCLRLCHLTATYGRKIEKFNNRNMPRRCERANKTLLTPFLQKLF